MLDTIVLIGPDANFKWALTGASEIKTYYNGEKTTVKEYSNQDGFRIARNPKLEQMRVEFSIPKLIVGNQWFNYVPHEENFYITLIEACALNFYTSLDHVYMSRIDIAINKYYETDKDAMQVLELYRTSKPHCQRISKFGHQKYKTSAVYYNKDYSMKIYLKDAEIKQSERNEYTPNGVLRFEIGYRISGIKSLDIPVTPWLGVLVTDLKKRTVTSIHTNIKKIMNDYDQKFQEWKPYKTVVIGENNYSKIIASLMQSSNLSLQELYLRGMISKSSYNRFNKKYRHELLTEKHCIDQKIEIPLIYQREINYTLNTKKIKNGNEIPKDAILWT